MRHVDEEDQREEAHTHTKWKTWRSGERQIKQHLPLARQLPGRRATTTSRNSQDMRHTSSGNPWLRRSVAIFVCPSGLSMTACQSDVRKLRVRVNPQSRHVWAEVPSPGMSPRLYEHRGMLSLCPDLLTTVA
ncbi:hypothetical protein ElyMa_001765000 [Elysia marginata]|uniref:Uncharacterized protein n=1 Tax=Elysia marginata TaxID=1093978 RepID=A0AAV4ECV0_9GAST|nr:hypothetical protein ElyMa_001765000 [Elysia marginata]